MKSKPITEKILFEELFETPLRNGLFRPSHTRGSGIKMVNMKEIFANTRIGSIPMEKVPMNDDEKQKFLLQEGDLLFARQSLVYEGTGKCVIITNSTDLLTFESHIIRARLNKFLADSRFYYYYFNSKIGRQIILSIVEQTAASGIRGNDLKKLSIIFFPIEDQRKIAKIFWSLDNLIENLQKQNKVLEQSVQEIFKSWFVDFNFPNEKGNAYKYSGGKLLFQQELEMEIPSSWKISTIGKEFMTILGGTPSRNEKKYWENGNISWINSGAIKDFPIMKETEKITEHGLKNSAARLMPKRTTVLPFVVSLGKEIKISILGIESSGNQSVLGIVENETIHAEYIYSMIQSIKNNIYSALTGGAQQHINKSNVDNTRIFLPEEKILQKFNQISKPMFERIINNSLEIKLYKKIRDTLLPKLMSGEIRV